MWRWGVDDVGLSPANLNSTLTVFDAVADASVGAAVGRLYPSPAAAFAAGHKRVLVRPGLYVGDVDVPDMGILEGVCVPRWSSAATTDQAVIQGQVRTPSAGNGCRIANLHITPGADNALVVRGPFAHVHRVYAMGGTGGHFRLETDFSHLVMTDCRSINCAGNAWIYASTATVNIRRCELHRCLAYNAAGHGFVLGTDTDSIDQWRQINLMGCEAWQCGVSYGNGFTFGRRWRGAAVGCMSISTGGAGHGFYFWHPNHTAAIRSIVGCHAVASGGYGFMRSALSYTARELFAGCVAANNSGGYWGNFAATPSVLND